MPKSKRASGGRGPNGPKSPAPKSGSLTKEMLARMEACQTAEALNDQVIVPFMAALEDVCRARGYVLNIYGEAGNLIFTGSEDAAEEIYAMVEEYLAAEE